MRRGGVLTDRDRQKQAWIDVRLTGGVVRIDARLGYAFRFLVDRDITVEIGNAVSGQVILLRFEQDTTGGHTVAPGDAFVFRGTPVDLTPSTAAGAVSYAWVVYDDVAEAWDVIVVDGTGGGAGTMTSLTMPTAEFDVASPTGAAVVTWDTQAATKFFGGPESGAAATPSFRTIKRADLPGGVTTTQTITTTGDGTWAHPAGATWVEVECDGAGGGGGGGQNTANGAGNHLGGSGGGGGCRTPKRRFLLADLADPVPYHVGAGGSAGSGAAGSSSASGGDGGAGESTTWGATTVAGSKLCGGGGGGGGGGSVNGCSGGGGGGTAGPGISTTAAVHPTNYTFGGPPNLQATTATLRYGSVGGEGGWGGLGGAGGTSRTGLGGEWGGGGGGGRFAGNPPTQDGRGGTSLYGGGGGGAGGCSYSGTLMNPLAGGASGTFVYYDSGSASGGGAAGTSGASPTAGTAGAAGDSSIGGFGGGGGGATDTNDTAGAAGGAGGACGGGGGGGGGGKGTGAGGNGGAGGRGEIRLIYG